MKEKLIAALTTRYKNMGLSATVIEGVADTVANYITDDSLEAFVAGAEGMLKQYQSIGDKARGESATAKREAEELRTKITELEEKLKGNGGNGGSGDDTGGSTAEAIKAAIAEALSPLQTELASLKQANSLKEAVNNAESAFYANDYVKKYKDEASDAWERAVEMNEVTGGKMTADELKDKAMGYFNKAVARIGVDTAKPFVADTDHDDEGTMDWTAERERKQQQGKIPAKS